MKKSKYLLCLKKLTVANETVLVENIDLCLDSGEIIAVTGPSGCGKTSLLLAISGLTAPHRGEIYLHGKTPPQWGWPNYRQMVIYVHQRPVLLDLSVRENLARPFRYRSAKKQFSTEHAKNLLTQAGMDAGCLDQKARRLSIGEQQRVCLVRALLLKPQVLLLDEPTSALDNESIGAVEKLIAEEIKEAGRAALVVSHSTRQAQDFCDHCIDLKNYLPEQRR